MRSHGVKILITCALLNVLCVPLPVRAEVAVDWAASVTLFYVDGDSVFRSNCEPGTTIYNRANCQINVQASLAVKFFPLLAAGFGARLDEHQRVERESWANIEAVDARLLELIASETPSGNVSWEDLQAKRDELAALESRVVAAQDQIARLTDALAGGEEDPEPTLQLDAWRRRLTALIQEQSALQDSLADLTEQYVADRVETSDDAYLTLIAMREGHLQRLAAAREATKADIEEIIHGEQLSQKVREQGFTWISNGHRQISGWQFLSPAFDEAEVASRTFRTSTDESRRIVTITVPRRGFLEAISCRFPVYRDSRCDVAIESPDSRTDRAVLSFTNVMGEVRFDTAERSAFAEELTRARFFGVSAEGEWRIHLACSMITTGPTNGGTSCAIRLKP